ncbi:MAG: hypothetical protein COT85_06020 [Chlamydiae bacterium CG10_big_fil_rev_8_21_14_0_10_42_34]|nr:MAG: hypothetical protein COT85_06020 [Chlamydiae bacterium CG10_big_fil_rev_8_21_14_0_10_42_34]
MLVSHRGHLQARLQTIFSSIDRGSIQPYFYTKQFGKEKTPSVVAIFDNGIDPDPAYSGSVLGRIFLDAENNLSCAMWPLGKEKNLPWRTEILLPNVEDFEFEFLGKNSATKPGKKERIRPINGDLAWRTSWPKSQKSVPSIIRLSIQENRGGNPLHFAFILPTPDPFVTYVEKKAI